MGSRSACCPEVFVEGVLGEGMGETQALGDSFDLGQESRLDPLIDDVQYGVLVHSGHRGQHLDIEVPPDHRGLGQHLSHVLTQAVHPLSHHLPHALGETLLIQVVARHPTPRVVLVDRARSLPDDAATRW